MVKGFYSVKQMQTRRPVSKTLCLAALLSLPLALPLQAENSLDGTTDPSALALTQRKHNKIVGVVLDSKTQEPLIGVTVKVKGTTTGAATDINGKFELNVAPSAVLEISYVGYASKEVKVGNQTVLSITLSEDAKTIGDVVVTAFGTGQKKVSVTGSVQTVRPSDLKVPTTNLSNSFAGRLSGVISYQRSGEPGSNGSNFYIRGIATTSGIASPLIILDGVEVASADLNALDPDIIDSFSVLKDATASAMYGTRGANGVIIVKTKSGADLDRPVIGVRLESWMTQPVGLPKFVGAEKFMRMFNEAVTNQGTGAQLYSEERIQNTLSGVDPILYPNIDWYKELFKDYTFNQRANVNVRGGTNKITYFMNLNASHETGMLKNRSRDFFSYNNNTDYMKYAFQSNVDYHITSKAKLALHLNAQLNELRGPVYSFNDIFARVIDINSVDFPVQFPKGNDDWYHWGTTTIGSTPIQNPLAQATKGYKDLSETTVIANLNYDHDLDFITKGLSVHGLFSYKNWSRTNSSREQGMNYYRLTSFEKDANGNYQDVSLAGNPSKPRLGLTSGQSGDSKMYFQANLNYDHTFGKHDVSAMALYSLEEYRNNVFGTDLIASLPKRRMNSAFRVTYGYDNRYLLEINAGYTGSENFAKGHRFGFFPSFSLGWNVSREAFWKPLKNVVSNLKIRGSYGLVGNDQIGGARFVYLAIVNRTGGGQYRTGYDGSYATMSGPTFNRLQNDAITWEIGKKLNVGVDLQLFNSLNLVVDAYQEVRSNIFQQKNSIPNTLGTSGTEIYGNFAKVKNWGIEFAADYGKQINNDLSVQFKGTFTFARNRILEYDEAPGLAPGKRAVGTKINTMWGYVADGYYIDDADIAHNPTSTLGNITIAPGDIKYVDQPDAEGKYNGKIDSDDLVPLGYPTVPEIMYGFGPSISYKNWDFSFFFQGQSNVSLMVNSFEPFGTQLNRSALTWIGDSYWSKDNQNPNAVHPRLTQHRNNNNMQGSTHWLRDASFLKLRTVEIGYTFWKKKARVYLNANNVATFSSFKLWDPEMGSGSGMSYPLQRTFNLGLSLTFK